MYHGVCSFSSGGEHGAGGWTFEWSGWRHGASAHLSPLLDAMETWSLPPTGAVCFWPHRGVRGRAYWLASTPPRGELEGWLPYLGAFPLAGVHRGVVAFSSADFVPLVVPERAAGLAACVFSAPVDMPEPFRETGFPGFFLRPEVALVRTGVAVEVADVA